MQIKLDFEHSLNLYHFNSKKMKSNKNTDRFKFFFIRCEIWCVSFGSDLLKCHESGSKLDVLVHSYRRLWSTHTHTHTHKRTRIHTIENGVNNSVFTLQTENFLRTKHYNQIANTCAPEIECTLLVFLWGMSLVNRLRYDFVLYARYFISKLTSNILIPCNTLYWSNAVENRLSAVARYNRFRSVSTAHPNCAGWCWLVRPDLCCYYRLHLVINWERWNYNSGKWTRYLAVIVGVGGLESSSSSSSHRQPLKWMLFSLFSLTGLINLGSEIQYLITIHSIVAPFVALSNANN